MYKVFLGGKSKTHLGGTSRPGIVQANMSQLTLQVYSKGEFVDCSNSGKTWRKFSDE